MYVNPFKTPTLVMEILVGYRDPHLVPIKSFYQQEINFNYLSLLINSGDKVKMEFIITIEEWMIKLKDREDHWA